ncbi:MAG TPA: hypothetical protein VKA63_09445 [Candidatus Krumholzibacteria bacterium]|nr:hypothetical protein [Candidatus Krumholzibacteria bacterium]
MPKKELEESEHRYRFARRWEKKRRAHNPRAMWTTLIFDAILIALIMAMVYIGFRIWH